MIRLLPSIAAIGIAAGSVGPNSQPNDLPPLPLAQIEEPLDLLDDRKFATLDHPARIASGAWEVKSMVLVMTTLASPTGGPISDRLPLMIGQAISKNTIIARAICVPDGGDAVPQMFLKDAPDCAGGVRDIADGALSIRRACTIKGSASKLAVDVRFHDNHAVGFTEIRSPLSSGGEVLVQSFASAVRTGSCDPANFEPTMDLSEE